MVGWNTEYSGRIARERTGGAGYLAVNQIGDVITGSHSAVTAEGDNKVLMQKVVKDILSDTRNEKHDAIKFSKVRIETLKTTTDLAGNLGVLRDLIYYRESFEIKQLMNVLKKQMIEKERPFFTVW